MNREIDKIMALKKVVNDNEKESIDNIVETFSNGFKKILLNTRKYLLSGDENFECDLSHEVQAMDELIAIADKTGSEEFIFPELKSIEDAKVYLLKFGKEVIKGN